MKSHSQKEVQQQHHLQTESSRKGRKRKENEGIPCFTRDESRG
jgi:hypothetical protein